MTRTEFLSDPEACENESRVYLRYGLGPGEPGETREALRILRERTSLSPVSPVKVRGAPLKTTVLRLSNNPLIDVGCSLPTLDPQEDTAEIYRVLAAHGVRIGEP